MKLTEKRLRILKKATAHPQGLVERPYMTGFERVTWDRNAAYLVVAGWLTQYVHGGFEITKAGRTAISVNEGRKNG